MRDLSIASQTLRNDSDDLVPHPDRSCTAVGVLRVASASPAPLLEARAEFSDLKFPDLESEVSEFPKLSFH